jgi:hypothetical protein
MHAEVQARRGKALQKDAYKLTVNSGKFTGDYKYLLESETGFSFMEAYSGCRQYYAS